MFLFNFSLFLFDMKVEWMCQYFLFANWIYCNVCACFCVSILGVSVCLCTNICVWIYIFKRFSIWLWCKVKVIPKLFFFWKSMRSKEWLNIFSGPAFCKGGYLFLATLSIATLEPGTCTWQLGQREKFPASYGYWTGAPPLSETGALTTELPVSTITQNQHVWSFYLLELFFFLVPSVA